MSCVLIVTEARGDGNVLYLEGKNHTKSTSKLLVVMEMFCILIFIMAPWISEKAREFQKNIYFCFIDYAKAFDYVDHNKLWKILKEMGIPEYLTCLLKNLCAGQESVVRPGLGTTDWF